MQPLQVVYLSAIAGLIAQFISGVLFYFYNMTLQQLNQFHSKLEDSRRVCVGLFVLSRVNDTKYQDKAKLEIIKFLTSTKQPEMVSKEKQNGKVHEAGTTSSTSASSAMSRNALSQSEAQTIAGKPQHTT